MKRIVLMLAVTLLVSCGTQEVITKEGKYRAQNYKNWKPVKRWSLSH